MSLSALAQRLRSGELSARSAVEDSLDRIARLNPELNAFLSVHGEEALAEADRLDALDERGPLHGVPVGIKDVIDVAGMKTTAASKVLADNVATRDAATVEALRAAGAVVVGKVNTHEFAFGALTTSKAFGAAHNPWDTTRVCGGSSGGSGAAVGARLVPLSLGTDTAGSVRIPSCFCGVTGLRPTTGRVSNRGVVPVSFTFDTVGPLAESAADIALAMDVIAGHDLRDATTDPRPVADHVGSLGRGVDGLRIGLVRSLVDRADSRIAALVLAAIEELERQGAQVVDVEPPLMEEAATILQLMLLPEAAEAHLPWLRTKLADYGTDVRARLLTGLLIPATATVTGRRARRWYCDRFSDVWEQVDVLAAPQMLIMPPRIGEETVEVDGRQILYRLSVMPTNSPWTLAGLPTASVPCGFVDGMPTAFALVGQRFAEPTILAAAHAYQQATDWHTRQPAIAS